MPTPLQILVRAFESVFSVDPPENRPAIVRFEQTAEILEKKLNQETIASHFYAAGGYMRRAIKKGLQDEQKT